MILAGLQKLTLLDYPGLVACTIFTAGCDLRCPYCHNASIVLPDRDGPHLSEDALFAFLQKRRGLLDGVAVTGGEPLLHRDLPALLRRIKELGYKIKLDTNGTFPDRLRSVVFDGLADRVAMDIKNSPEKYPAATGTPAISLNPIRESAAFLLEGKVEYEFRTTAVRGLHEPEDFRSIGKWIAGAREYYIQNFCDSGDIIDGHGIGAFSKDELASLADAARPFVPSVKIRGL
ncbi:MAG TPA: anaerobic ribonucleoside-triphosphate reductase activating protein [Clostridiales bacterium]|jgi:pyruvate formate lyase activating enzyme|nr:anaerobic ribonucleoside-triphosphate reductase activating protein [Clostridiales bacterium]